MFIHRLLLCSYKNLVSNAHERRSQLRAALELADEWAKLSQPLATWLDTTERTLASLGGIPTDEGRLAAQMESQKVFFERITRR